MAASANIAAILAEGKRLQAIENHRTLVRAFTALYEVFARRIQQNRLILATVSGEHRRCAFIRPGIIHLLAQVRAGVITATELLEYAPGRSCEGRRTRRTRGKAVPKLRGVVLERNKCGQTLVKLAARRPGHA